MESFELATLDRMIDQGRVAEYDEEVAIESTPDRCPSVSSLPLPSLTKVKTTPRPTSTPPFSSQRLVRPSRSVITSAVNNPATSSPANPPSTAITLLTLTPPAVAFTPTISSPPLNIPRSPYSFTPFFPPQQAYMQFPHPNIPAVHIYVQLWSSLPPTTGPGRLYRQHRRGHAGPVTRWAWRNRGPLWCLCSVLVVTCICGLVMMIIVVSLEHAGILDKKVLDGEDNGMGSGTGTGDGSFVGPVD